MPIYAYQCETCAECIDEFNRIDDRHTNAPVCRCGAGQMTMRISPVRGSVQQDCHYVCPATGAKVTSYAQRRELMAKHNLVDARDITPAFVKRESDKQIAEDYKIAAGMDMPEEFQAPEQAAMLNNMLAERVAAQQ